MAKIQFLPSRNVQHTHQLKPTMWESDVSKTKRVV